MPDDPVGTSPGDPVGDRNPALSIGPADRSNDAPATTQTGFSGPSGPSGLGPVEPNRPAPTTDIFAGTPWLRPTDGPLIATDTKEIRTCPKCGVPLPVDAVSCQRCGRYVPGHKSAKKRLRKDDVDALIARVKADYQPVTTTDIHLCENLGLTLAELKITRPGSPDHQRSLGSVQTITAILEASRASRPTSAAAAITDLEQLSPNEVVERAQRVLQLATQARDAQRDGEDRIARAVAAHRAATPTTSTQEVVASATPLQAPTPEEVCPHCHEPPSRCAAMRTERPDVWHSLHWDHPDEIERRRELATREMYESLRRARTGGDPYVR